MRVERTRPGRAAAGWAIAFAATLGGAGESRAAPPAQTLAACAACHGADGNSPLPQFPSIAGQPKIFIENQLVLIREGLRDVPVMKQVMAGIDDAQIVELAKYFAAQPVRPAAVVVQPEKARQGERLSGRLLCGSCHLGDFSGQHQVPRLAGQHEAFLLASMKQFRDNPGPGRDTIMAATLRGLGDAELDQLAHYLAGFRAP